MLRIGSLAAQAPGADTTTAAGQMSSVRDRIHEALRCRRCGGSRMWNAVAWNGRGDFTPGGAAYAPSRMETLTPEQHCTCPGSLMWQLLHSLSTPEEQAALDAAQRAWDSAPGEVRLPMPEGGVAVMTPAQWRECVRGQWRGR